MMRLVCVDILVKFEIFPADAVPRYALYNEEGLVQMCPPLALGTRGPNPARMTEGSLQPPRRALCASSETLSPEQVGLFRHP